MFKVWPATGAVRRWVNLHLSLQQKWGAQVKQSQEAAQGHGGKVRQQCAHDKVVKKWIRNTINEIFYSFTYHKKQIT